MQRPKPPKKPVLHGKEPTRVTGTQRRTFEIKDVLGSDVTFDCDYTMITHEVLEKITNVVAALPQPVFRYQVEIDHKGVTVVYWLTDVNPNYDHEMDEWKAQVERHERAVKQFKHDFAEYSIQLAGYEAFVEAEKDALTTARQSAKKIGEQKAQEAMDKLRAKHLARSKRGECNQA